MTTNIEVTTTKSNKSILLKKTLIIAAAVSGLLIAGAIGFAAASSPELELELAE